MLQINSKIIVHFA